MNMKKIQKTVMAAIIMVGLTVAPAAALVCSAQDAAPAPAAAKAGELVDASGKPVSGAPEEKKSSGGFFDIVFGSGIVGTILWFTLFADGVPIAKNFTCFHVEGEAAADAKPVRAVWSAGTIARLGEKPEKEVFRFVPVEVTCDDKGFTKWTLSSAAGNRFLFEVTDERNYQEAMTKALREMRSWL